VSSLLRANHAETVGRKAKGLMRENRTRANAGLVAKGNEAFGEGSGLIGRHEKDGAAARGLEGELDFRVLANATRD
jgi:hypothetical protein